MSTSDSTPKRFSPTIPSSKEVAEESNHLAVIRRTLARRRRVEDAPDEPTRRRWTQEAAGRRAERIEKSAARQQQKKAAKVERQRTAIAREHLSADQVHLWDRPANRAVLDRVLEDAKERRLFDLPPRPEVEIGGIRRLAFRSSK